MSHTAQLKGKVALITGGSSGIGLTTARLFIEQGAKVVITGRNLDKLQAVQQELGENALALQADSVDAEALERAASAAVDKFGGLDIVFANAGISDSTPVGSTTAERFENVLRINVTGPFLTVQAALPHLKAGASVILVGSVIANSGRPGASAYAASKGAVTAMARSLVGELSPRGIRVNTVIPGPIRTPIWGQSTAEGLDKLDAGFSMSVPLQRMGEPEEIAAAVLFLASDAASYVQGAELGVDGGVESAPMGAPVYLQGR
ncbi:short-chain dehydrogenase [Saccharibacillus sp. O23]|uniref:SDR family NAD(P)-dependent oxidoreductase n=1 Tax=Saccharibacillus sp. O23 TaxID=2009338 RepID=UPI000B4E80C3|nr:glucose 1-dehydrogenase [Saccharibacillus sp. O23]OWR32705.1 short-chain dehydrogenase [Saccharibacillus sp. O23]